MSTTLSRALRHAAVAAPIGLLGLPGLGSPALPAGAATTPLVATPARRAGSRMAITVKGQVLRVTSKDTFTVRSGMHRYLVVLGDMTRVTVDHRRGTIHQVHAGDRVTVKGPLEMGHLHATSVMVTGM